MESDRSTETERRRLARRHLWEQAFEGLEVAGQTVLDAGTGEGHFTQFLAQRRPSRHVSITCVESEIAPARQRLGPLADRVEFRVGDLTAEETIGSERFDIVAADYLIAAVAAYSPFREVDCLRLLSRAVRPGGRLIVTGWEVVDGARPPGERAFRALFQLREAIHHLLGERPYREHPSWWVEKRATECGLIVERRVTIPDTHFSFDWFLLQAERWIDDIDPAPLREAIRDRWRELAKSLPGPEEFARGLPFGQLYAVRLLSLNGAVLLQSQ